MMKKIEEFAQLRKSDIPLVKSLKGKVIQYISFNYDAFINTTSSHTEISTQEVILVLDDKEIIVNNHCHESEYGTGLQYLLLREAERSNRPYHFNYKNENFVGVVQGVQVLGFKNIEQEWDSIKLELYKEKGVIPTDIDELVHKYSSQHIIRLILSNNNSIYIVSDLPNFLFIKMFAEGREKDYFKEYYTWIDV